MPPKLPTPTCTHHQTAEIQCLTCRGTMRLVTIEPGVHNFELRRYACPHCDTGESFLMSIGAPEADTGLGMKIPNPEQCRPARRNPDRP